MKYHTVLFKLKPEAPADEAKRIFEQISSLQGRVPGIVSIEQLVIEKSNAGNSFSHGYMVSFVNEAGKDGYMRHPLSKEVTKNSFKFIEHSLILDMERTHTPYKQCSSA